MAASDTPDTFIQQGQNRLLASLPEQDRARLAQHFEMVHLEMKETLYDADEPITHAWFSLSGVISIVTVMEDGTAVEVATVGNEGFVGIPLFLGARSTPGRAFSQVPGDHLRMEAAVFQEEVRNDGPFVNVLRRYTQGFLTQVAQSTACNRLHPVEERCARWLLMTHDRVGADTFPLTHEFLSQMLGVRRATVTLAMQMLQKAGMIEYARGRITVGDRAGLEEAACECYRIVRDEYDRLLPNGGEGAARSS